MGTITNSLERSKRCGSLVCWLLLTALGTAPAQTTSSAPPESPRDRMVLAQSLPKLDGKNVKVTLVEVRYGPGESSPPHSHPCAVIGYVLEGSLRTKVKGQSENVYKAGESFYESPNGIHEVSANASQTEPAKFIAYFVCDRDVPLSVAPSAFGRGEQP
jgi:quercetin dioxygenase-like cupin family protein